MGLLQIELGLRHGAAFHRLIALQIRPGPARFRFGGRNGGQFLRGFSFIHCHLRLGLFQLAAGRGEVGDCLRQFRFVIARINFQKRIAFLEHLIILNQQADNRS